MTQEFKKRAVVAAFSLGGWFFAKAHEVKDSSPSVIIGGLIGWAAADVLVDEKKPKSAS